jgi:hypothetical protein
MRTKHKMIAVYTLVSVMCIILSGCLIRSKSYIDSPSPDQSIWQEKLGRIVPGNTSKEWIITTFGLPINERQLENGVEILKYERSGKIKSEFSLFLIIDTETTKVTKEVLYFYIKDGIVQKYWMD